MVALGRYIYIIGGRLCPKAVEHDSSMQKDQERVISCVRRYNVRTHTWETCAPMSRPRTKFACTVRDNKIYVAGGQCKSDQAAGTSSTEFFDPSLNHWKSMASMSMKRYNCVGITWKGRIYAIGGFIGSQSYLDAAARSSAEIYDEKLDRWDFVPRMWDLDIPPNQIAAMNQKLFSSGDCFRMWKGNIECYEENEKIWTDVPGSDFDFAAKATTRRLFLTMAPIGNQLYFLTGYKMSKEDSRIRSEVHVFNTATDSEGWQSFEPSEEDGEKELCAHCCILQQES
ncbi:hypothetical protein ACS0TY_017499 [Phlomoides rotata]